jgi:hypothetical protein
MRSLIVGSICVFLLGLAGQAPAQETKTKAEIEKSISLLRKDVRSAKKQLIAASLVLTDAEALKFWPVYDQYAAEMEKLYTTRVDLVKEYAANQTTLTEDQAASLNKRSIDLDSSFTQLRKKYVPLFAKVLGGKAQALFFQLDKRISLLIDLQLAAWSSVSVV